MTREKILELYFKAIDKRALSSGEDIDFICGVTYFCKAMLAEVVNDEREVEEEPVVEEKPRKFGRGVHMDNEDVKRIYNLADLGKSQVEIADTIGCSVSAVCRRLKDYKRKNVTEPGKGTVDWIRELAAESIPLNEIAERVGYAESIVAKYAGGNVG